MIDFPEHDSYWTQTLEAARKYIGQEECVVAHEGFFQFFPKTLSYGSVNEKDLPGIDWIILHKDNGRQFSPQILRGLKKGFQPVFANEVFVILANNRLCPAPGYIDPHHVEALFGNGRILPRKWRVPFTWAFAILIFLLARPTPLLLILGGIVALTGLCFRAWATGYIAKNQRLATSGPYARVRNPLYLGNFLIGAGFVAASGHLVAGAICALIFAGSYARLMREEETALAKMFGQDYWDYRSRVPMFFPRFFAKQNGCVPDGKFDPGSYMKRGEYRALLGVVALWGMLVLKIRFGY